MADRPPLNVFGRDANARRLAQIVRARLTGAAMRSIGTEFSVTLASPRQLPDAPNRGVTVNVSLQYFEGSNGARQRAGMANFIRTNFAGSGLPQVLKAIPDLRMAVAIMASEPIRPDMTDSLFSLALEIAARSDGFIMDHVHGRIWSPEGLELGAFVSDSSRRFNQCDPTESSP